MSYLEISLIAIALAADAFSVGAVVGIKACSPRQVFRLSLHFGVFQGLLAALGALLGAFLYQQIQAYDHWVAFGLLEVIGWKMIVGALRKKETTQSAECSDPTRGWTMVGLSVAVSIDAFGTGAGMAMALTFLDLVAACAIIGVVASAGTWLGMKTGGILRRWMGAGIEVFGGLVLVALGIRMLWL